VCLRNVKRLGKYSVHNVSLSGYTLVYWIIKMYIGQKREGTGKSRLKVTFYKKKKYVFCKSELLD